MGRWTARRSAAQRAIVRQRVEEGGHDVPAERILARYPRTIKKLNLAVRKADLAMLYDSGGTVGPDGVNLLVRVAMCWGHKTRTLVANLPDWASVVLG